MRVMDSCQVVGVGSPTGDDATASSRREPSAFSSSTGHPKVKRSAALSVGVHA
ncbi:MAG: hypothetical protein ACTSWP_03000 [Candidatus Freyarchaeota archaeon]|nr:hypothetical protein [Candidatus Freyrarchaeum guaymaensis]